MLKGEAKTAYMRDYMRRKRGGLPTTKPTKPKAEWQPPQAMVDEIQHWRWLRLNAPCGLRDVGHHVLDGLTNETWSEADMMEACRRLKAHRDKLKAEREQRCESKPEIIWQCSFCGEPATPGRLLYGSIGLSICDKCVDEAANAMVCHRAQA